MISLISEITDSKGRRAARGWVFFDGDCAICVALARRFRRTMEKRGFGLAALQDPRVPALLGLAPDELLHEMRVVTTEDELYGGADAFVFLARQIWWAWPLYLVAKLPGVRRMLRSGYRWFADHRHCSSSLCGQRRGGVAIRAELQKRINHREWRERPDEARPRSAHGEPQGSTGVCATGNRTA